MPATIDMPAAREILRERIRVKRAPLLAALDVEFLRAQEAGADTADIVSRKQALRDLPQAPAIDAAATPDDLLAAWPADHLGPHAR